MFVGRVFILLKLNPALYNHEIILTMTAIVFIQAVSFRYEQLPLVVVVKVPVCTIVCRLVVSLHITSDPIFLHSSSPS